jgi:hypothetical protein
MDKKDRMKNGFETFEVLGQNVIRRRDFLRLFLYLSFTFPIYTSSIFRILFRSLPRSREILSFLKIGNPAPDQEQELSRSGFQEKCKEVLTPVPVNESFIFPVEASYYRNLAG